MVGCFGFHMCPMYSTHPRYDGRCLLLSRPPHPMRWNRLSNQHLSIWSVGAHCPSTVARMLVMINRTFSYKPRILINTLINLSASASWTYTHWPATRHLTTCYCQWCFQTTHLYTSIPSKTLILDCIPTSLLKSPHVIFSELIAKLATMSFKKVASVTRLKLFSSLLSSRSLTLIRAICQVIDPYPISTTYQKILAKLFLFNHTS